MHIACRTRSFRENYREALELSARHLYNSTEMGSSRSSQKRDNMITEVNNERLVMSGDMN